MMFKFNLNTLEEKKFLLVIDDVWDYGYDGWNLLRSPFGAGAPGSMGILDSDLNEVQVQLSKTLAGEKFLLVLDDVWDYGRDGWNLLRSPFGAGAPGSKITVTTRDRGLIEQPKGGDQMEDLGRKYFHELVSRSFFLPLSGNKSLFIMHDLINDLAQDVTGDKCFRLENNLEGGKQSKISVKARHASYVGSYIDGIKKFKVFDDAKCLRTFIQFFPLSFHATRYLFHDLLPQLKCLRELRLHYNSMDELPDAIGDLKHLRYLDVSCSGITRLPDTLPPNIGRLVNLRHFDMTGVHIPSSEEMSLHIDLCHHLDNYPCLKTFTLKE
ncbi:hypothetical protein ACSBR1_018348 [Camellia fascicularis]